MKVAGDAAALLILQFEEAAGKFGEGPLRLSPSGDVDGDGENADVAFDLDAAEGAFDVGAGPSGRGCTS